MKSKKIIVVVLILSALMAISFSGCAKTDKNTTGSTTANTTQNTTEIPNPMVEKASTAEIKNALDFTFDSLPTDISSIKYFTIDDTIAQADFTSNGVAYTVRKAAATVDNIAGVYTEFSGSQTIANSTGIDVSYKYNDGAEGLALWTSGAFIYSVFCESGFDSTAMHSIVDPVS